MGALISKRPILLVENNPMDASAVGRALAGLHIKCRFMHVPHPDDALLYMRNHAEALPCLILLNPDGPDMSGLECLRAIKSDDTFKRIPVVLLANGDWEPLVAAGFALGAAGYMVKSEDSQRLQEVLEAILRYWSISRLPLE